MAGIYTPSEVAGADSARGSMGLPGFHEGSAVYRCMGLPLTHGGSMRKRGFHGKAPDSAFAGKKRSYTRR
jgi:hypothetical protein